MRGRSNSDAGKTMMKTKQNHDAFDCYRNALPALEVAMLIVLRCRKEGREDFQNGAPILSCPYSEDLEKEAWRDGWTKAAAFA